MTVGRNLMESYMPNTRNRPWPANDELQGYEGPDWARLPSPAGAQYPCLFTVIGKA
jgi:hypothetical protein